MVYVLLHHLLEMVHVILCRNFVWDMTLSKLYAIALLSTLNARAGWRNAPPAGPGFPSNILFPDISAPSTQLALAEVRSSSFVGWPLIIKY